MRRVFIAAVAVLQATCTSGPPPNPPPSDVFYFPTGLHHVRPPGSKEGVLYVVSSNFDKRYDTGLLTAVDLDEVAMPPFGGFTDGGAQTITDLHVHADAGATVALASFGSNIAAWQKPDGGERMFIVARSEGRKLMAVDTSLANPLVLSCIPSLTLDAGIDPSLETPTNDCGAVGASLTYNELSPTGIPRAPSPLMTAVSADGVVWVTSGDIVDSPRGSGTNLNAYVVRTRADEGLEGGPSGHIFVGDNNFIAIGPVPSDGVTVGQRWAYVTGRYAPTGYNASFAYSGYTPNTPGGTNPTYTAAGYPATTNGVLNTTASTVLVRLIDQANLVNVGLELQFVIPDSRGIALSSDESRLYMLGRLTPYVIGSDQLIIASIKDPTGMTTGTQVNVIRAVPLCDEPQEVRTVPRAGRSDLVVVTCSGGSVAAQGGATAAGFLVLYDDDVGNLVGQVPNVGLQPDSLAIDERPAGTCPNPAASCMRVFVSNFTDGRVAMIDVTDTTRPQEAHIVGWLGAAQTCVTRNFSDTTCDGGVLMTDGGP
jgi:hypothetical protein